MRIYEQKPYLKYRYSLPLKNLIVTFSFFYKNATEMTKTIILRHFSITLSHWDEKSIFEVTASFTYNSTEVEETVSLAAHVKRKTKARKKMR